MDRLSAKHRDWLLFGAYAAPMAIACGGLDVLAAVPALVAALLLYVLLRRKIPENGSMAGLLPRWLLLPELLFLPVAAAALASMAPVCWSGSGTEVLFPLTLLVLAGAAAHQGNHAVGRVASILGGFVGLFLALVLAFALPEASPAAEVGNWVEAVPVLAAALLPVCGLYLPAEKGKPAHLWLPLLALTVALLAVTDGKRGELPVMTAVKGIAVLGVLQRFEALVACALTIGLFLALSVLAGSAGEIFQCMGFRRVSGAVILAPAAALIFWIESIPEWAMMLGCSVFWGLIPISALLVVPEKEKTKKSKKSKKRC